MGNFRNIAKRLDSAIGGPTRAMKQKWRRREYARKFPLPEDVEQEIDGVLSQIPKHWCHPLKPRVMAHLIVEKKLTLSVEIGVFTGASFLPQAIAFRKTGGKAIGIDPYSAAEAAQKDNRDIMDPISEEAEVVDWEAVYSDILTLIRKNDLESACEVLRMTSKQAAALIPPEVDMLHIDGNHDYERVREDIENYLPKLRIGGFLVMDDIGWGTIAPQYERLKQQMGVVYEMPGNWACLLKTKADPA